MMTREEWVAAKEDLAEPGDLLPEGWTWEPWQRVEPVIALPPYYASTIWAGPPVVEDLVISFVSVYMPELERHTTRDARLQLTRRKLQDAVFVARAHLAGIASDPVAQTQGGEPSPRVSPQNAG